MPKTDVTDKASAEYWSRVWQGYELPAAIDPNTATYVHKQVHVFLRRHLQNASGSRLIEIGCGTSAWLPYFAREFGVSVAGIDYSEVGCEMARRILARYDIPAEIYLGDAFDPPPELIGAFDIVISLGVVEHFTDTASTLASFARFARPGGLVLTLLPNLAGWIGAVQKRLDRSIYDKHVPLTREDIANGCEKAGLQVLECSYAAGATDFSMCNLNDTPEDTPTYPLKLYTWKILMRVSRLLRNFDITPRKSNATSIVAAAIKR